MNFIWIQTLNVITEYSEVSIDVGIITEVKENISRISVKK